MSVDVRGLVVVCVLFGLLAGAVPCVCVETRVLLSDKFVPPEVKSVLEKRAREKRGE